MSGSPWGNIQYSKVFEPGCKSVGTAGHGGFMLTKRYANEHLSPAAISRGSSYGNYLCYEEDCDACIPMYELRHLWPQFREHYISDEFRLDVEGHLLRSLSYWNVPYLLERGIEPDAEAYQRYLAKEEEERMRRGKHPDLITSAMGSWHGDVPECAIGVYTADGKFHLVTADSYAIRTPNLLSLCEIFPGEVNEDD